MTEEQPTYDTDTLKSILAADQRSQSEKEHDWAVAKAAVFTSNHYRILKAQGLPDHLVERLTLDFQEAYLGALLAPAYAFLSGMGADE